MRKLMLALAVVGTFLSVIAVDRSQAFIPTVSWTVGVRSSSTNTSYAWSVAADSSGNSYVVGAFYGTVDFDPSAGTTNLAPDETLGAFIAKYNASGALEWAFDMGYGNSSSMYDVKIDSAGDIWVVGALSGKMNPLITQVNVNPRGTATYVTGLAANTSHAVVLKYNPSGILLDAWKPLRATTGGSSRIWAFDFHGSNHLVLSGAFEGDHDADPDANVVQNITSSVNDAFVGVYTRTGAYGGIRTAGGSGQDVFKSVDIDPAGQVVVGGRISHALGSPMGTLVVAGSTINVGGGAGAGVVASYDWDGTTLSDGWAFPIGSNDSYDDVVDVAFDNAGRLLVSGTVEGNRTHNFKGTSATNANVTVPSAYTVASYIARYTSAGAHELSHLYANTTGATFAVGLDPSMSVGSDGSVYVSGTVEGTTDFDTGAGTLTMTTAANVEQNFIARYDPGLSLLGVSYLSSTSFPILNVADVPGSASIRSSHEFGGSSTTTTRPLVTSFGPDTVAPAAPGRPDLDSGSDTGTSFTDNITNDSTPTISVTAAESGGTVTVQATANGQSNVTCSISLSGTSGSCILGTLANGDWSVTAVHQDASGNVSASSTALTITIDTVAPILMSTVPMRDATNVDAGGNIVLTYDEAMMKGSGNILVKSGGSTCPTTDQTISVSNAAVSVSGSTVTINPPADLAPSTVTCLQFNAGVLRDIAGNNAVLHDPTAAGGVRFTTAAGDITPPTATITAPSSPANSRTLVYAVSFSEQVSGIAPGDFTNTGTATCTFAVSASSGTAVSVTATCTTDGTVIMELATNSVQDTASNTGPTSAVTASTVTIDTVGPTTTTAAPSNTVAPPTTVAPSNTVAPGTTLPPVGAGPGTGETPATVPAGGATTTTTTTPAATTTTVPAIEVPEVSDDGGALVVNGERIEATITRENNQLVIAAGVIRARISAVKRGGGRAPLDADGRIRMETGDSIEVEVTGFGASSPVAVWMYSDPVLLGRSRVDSLGALAASYEVPDSVDGGRHTVVLVGESARQEELTFALAVFVGAESDGPSTWTLLVGIPLGLAVLGALIIPAIIRRRREESARV